MKTGRYWSQGWDKRVPLYGPPQYYNALKRLAQNETRPLTNMIRECVKREAERQGVWEEEVTQSDDDHSAQQGIQCTGR